MPSSQYVAGREPPSRSDRLLAHPFVVPLALVSLAVGIQIIAAALTGHAISRSLAEAPVTTQLIVGLPLIIGAPVALTGALHLGRRMSLLAAMSVERIGCTALAAGWAAYCIGVVASGNPYGTLTAHIAAGVGAAFLLRAVALWLSERRVKARLDSDTTMRG